MSKVPLPGRTKSRLQEKAGAREAALFHRACLYDLQRIFRSCEMPARIYITGGSCEEFRSSFPHPLPEEFAGLKELDWSDFAFYRQQGKDLGERMLFAVQESLTEFQEVIVLGSDIPGIDQNLLEQACAVLQHNDLVLGPAMDGGYYLMGLKRADPFLFRGIEWGSGLVLEQTLQSARQHHLKVGLLPVRHDIDRWQDLVAWTELACNSRTKSTMAWRYADYVIKSKLRA